MGAPAGLRLVIGRSSLSSMRRNASRVNPFTNRPPDVTTVFTWTMSTATDWAKASARVRALATTRPPDFSRATARSA